MAQTYVDENGTLVIPGAYPSIKVQADNSGLSTTGVVMLVGEAEQGPACTAEVDFSTNYFGPGQLAAVKTKYGEGPIVNAMSALGSPSADPRIAGSVSRVYIAKTNVSDKASASLLRSGLTAYATLGDKSYGEPGNMVRATVTEYISEVAPTTGAFTYFPAGLAGGDASAFRARVNGGGELALPIAANTMPPAFVGSIAQGASTGLNALTGILATGGEDRGVIAVIAGTLAVAATVATNTIVVTISTAWAVIPTVGDTLVISATSVVKGEGAPPAATANVGVYRVTAANATTITAVKIFNENGDVPDGGVVDDDDVVNVNATPIASATADLICYSPITVQNVTGTDRDVLDGLAGAGITVTGTLVNSNLKLTLATGSVWAALPQVNDLMLIPSSSPVNWYGPGGGNGGWYRVTEAASGTGAGASYVVATRLSNGDPEAFVATNIAASTDLVVYRPAIDGLGKTIEIYDGVGAVNISTNFKTVAGAAVSWISTATTPYILKSSAEYKTKLAVNRATDGANEEIKAGGRVALNVGYDGTTCTFVIDGSDLDTTPAGGLGAPLSIDLAKYKTLADLAAYINSRTGYSCSLDTTVVGQMSPLALDEGTYNICGAFQGSKTGRIKVDGYLFYKEVVTKSVMVQLGTGTTSVQPDAGLPEAQAEFFLSGGTKGITTNAIITTALAKLELVPGNFLVPLFSRDATEDIADDLTDASSTYTIDDILTACKDHILKMSQIKRRKSRQLLAGKQTTFLLAKEAANNLASARIALAFQDQKKGDAVTGDITQFQPWMGAVLAAGMQSAAFYKAIVHKQINTSGVLQAAADFDPEDLDQLEDALQNGLLIAQNRPGGGFRWVSDQTTYGADSNFVYNSIQAVYCADVLAATTAERMERMFVGESVADISAAVAVAAFKSIMADMRRLKLIVGDDEAPEGYRNLQIRISGNAMVVSVAVKLATAIYFIPISFLVQPVQQSAAA